MMQNSMKGVGVALVTPFTEEGSVDFQALESLVEYVITGGVDYLVVLGTTAETATLSPREKAGVIECIASVNARRLPLVIGLGSNNTVSLEEEIRDFDFLPFSALLSVTPYYNKPSQEGLYRHYKRVAEASPVPVILYNVPSRTGVNLLPATVLRLAEECENILGVKEASGNLPQAAYILRDCPRDFRVISGDDALTLPMLALGGDGVISVAANAFPRLCSLLVREFFERNTDEARTLYLRLLEATDALFAEGNPTGVKAALAHKGLIGNYLRLPLVPASESLCQRLQELIDLYDLK